MKHFRAHLLIVLALLFFATSYSVSAYADSVPYRLGDKVEDFTFATYDGQQVKLSDVLQQKDAVLINIWASWCGPCRNEFPYIQAAYDQYQDQIEVLAMSCEPSDTADTLAAFATTYQLTFKIGQDPVGFLEALRVNSIPTSIMIDRFGTICYIQTGAFPDATSIECLFDAFIGNDYAESILLSTIPPKAPDVAPASEEELSQALNTANSGIVFTNPTDTAVWPMLVTEIDDRMVVVSSNQGIQSSISSVNARISASTGDVLVITFKLSSEPIFDVLQICVNDQVVKSFAGNEEWQTYAYAFPADGDYQLSFSYVKNSLHSAGEDTLWIDSISIVSGDAARATLAQNPAYPVADKLNISVRNETAKKIIIEDSTGNIASHYGDSLFYLIPDDKAVFTFDMTKEFDPEIAIVYFNYDGQSYALSDCLMNGEYIASSAGDSIKTTGYCDSSVVLYPDLDTPGTVLTYFKSEEDIDAFLAALTKDSAGNILASWHYVETSPSAKFANIEGETLPDKVSYVLRCIDQNGEPVSGAMLQICDEHTCQVLRSDENGICTFEAAPYEWEIHVLKSPAGYTAVSTEVVLSPLTGGEMTFEFNLD